MRLDKLEKLIDETRISLLYNLRAYDDDLADTYYDFITNATKLNKELNKLILKYEKENK